jgi:septum formation protein
MVKRIVSLEKCRVNTVAKPDRRVLVLGVQTSREIPEDAGRKNPTRKRSSPMMTQTPNTGAQSRPLLVLASASPRRRALLHEHGYAFEVRVPAGVEEIAPAHLSPGETVLANARAKARACRVKQTREVVLGVDTEVFFAGRVLGKPADMDAAFAMLGRLNGRTHEVYSGVWIAGQGRERGFVEVTRVHFHRRSGQELRRYLARIHPLDKAGAYAAQEDRGEMIASVEGSFSNVIGLPMERLREELRAFGI